MHDDMRVLYFYGMVTSSQVMPILLQAFSDDFRITSTN